MGDLSKPYYRSHDKNQISHLPPLYWYAVAWEIWVNPITVHGQLFILVVWGSKSEGQLFILVVWGEQYIEEIDNRICIDTYVSKHVHSLSDSNHISHLLPWCHSRGDLKKPHYRSNVSDPMSWPFPRNENTKLLCDLFYYLTLPG
jgi:hypothetical protein